MNLPMPPCSLCHKVYDTGRWAHETCNESIRAALVWMMMWAGYYDRGTETCDCIQHPPRELCVAMRALGWGEHWDAKVFERKALPDGTPIYAVTPTATGKVP